MRRRTTRANAASPSELVAEPEEVSLVAHPAHPPDFGGSGIIVGGAIASAPASVGAGAVELADATGAFVALRSSSGTSERIIVASWTVPRGANAVLVAGAGGAGCEWRPLPGGPPQMPRIGLWHATEPVHA